MRRLSLLALPLIVAGCSDQAPDKDKGQLAAGPETKISDIGKDLPSELNALIQKTIPGMTVSEAERKEREGRVYFDVEGTRPDGSEVELDILQEGTAFRVVEIQRDIAWASAPAAARAAAGSAKDAFEPERVIESTQTDGSVIFELFAPGKKDEPAMEVQMKDGKANLLKERWDH